MLMSLAKFKEFSLQIVSQRVVVAHMHWMGRSVLCAGEDCPACAFRSPRLVYYVGALCQRERRVVEVPSSFADVIDWACRHLNRDNPVGICIRISRFSARDTWKAVEAQLRPLSCDPMAEFQIAREVAIALRIGTPMANERWQEWIDRVRETQRVILRNCVAFV